VAVAVAVAVAAAIDVVVLFYQLPEKCLGEFLFPAHRFVIFSCVTRYMLQKFDFIRVVSFSERGDKQMTESDVQKHSVRTQVNVSEWLRLWTLIIHICFYATLN
jgi:hypothetical protein